MNKLVKYIGILGLVATMTGCSLLKPSGNSELESINITPGPSFNLSIGSSLSLSATASPSSASLLGLSWSSNDEAIATVTKTGIVSGLSSGTATITASLKNIESSVDVTVVSSYVDVTSFDISPLSIEIYEGDTEQLSWNVLPSNATNKNLTFKSQNTSIASVSNTGLVTGLKAGSTNIIATPVNSSLLKTIPLTVISNGTTLVESISISPSSFNLSVNKTKQLSAGVLPNNASNKNVSWSSSNTTVASVSNTGLVTALKAGSSTIFATAADGSNISGSATLTVSNTSDGYKLASLKYGMTTVRDDIAPATGKQKVLICPIALGGSPTYSWSTTNLAKIDSYIFGAKNDTPSQWNSFKTYYESASIGNLEISGERAPLYQAPSTYTESYFNTSNESTNYSHLFDMFDKCVTWIGNNGIDLDSYDNNNDGWIDSIHFVVNGSDKNSNESALWPHMYNTGASQGTIAKPTANVYSLSNLGHYSDARTTIHEQGHIFGLDDYYDYSYSDRDYVGGADMQSYNMFDWNSFSKMSVGWTKPYVLDGTKDEVSITINPAATTGDCILIDSGDWNETPFDEYILIELFSPVGNNKDDWSSWTQSIGSAGIRLYHVDARLWGYNYSMSSGQLVDDVTKSSYANFTFANTNSYNDSDAYVNLTEFDPYHLLHLIQADGKDDFSSSKATSLLSSGDLFKTGSSFSMSQFGNTFFYNKTTMNDGSVFPYTIYFDSVSASEATVRIVKN